MGYLPEQKPRTALPFIIHQADLMAARIEFEQEWLPKFKNPVTPKQNGHNVGEKKPAAKTKALGSIKSEGLKNMLDSL
jgi:hypothetical protein